MNRRPLVRVGAKLVQLPSGDTLDPTLIAFQDVAGQNLVYNPSFEQSGVIVGAVAGVADGYFVQTASGAAASWSLVPSTLDPSGQAQRLDLTGLSASLWGRLSTNTPYCAKVLAQTDYMASINFKATAGLRVKLQVRQIAGSSELAAFETALVTATGDWQFLTLPINGAAGLTQLGIGLVVYGTASISSGYIEIDRGQIELGRVVTGWRDNGQASLALAVRAGLRQFYLDGAGISANATLDNTYAGRWVGVLTAGIQVTMPSAAAMLSGQTIRILNQSPGSITVAASGSQGLVINRTSFSSYVLQQGEWFEFAANTGNTAWYGVGHGFMDTKSLLPTLEGIGSQNLAYNSAMRQSRVTDVADGWKLDAPGSPGSSTGVMTRVVSYINPDEYAQRIAVTNLNTGALYRSLTNDPLFPVPSIAEGQDAVVSIYVKGTAGLGVRIFIQAVNSGGSVVGTVSNTVALLDGTSQRISMTYASLPSGTVRLQVYYRLYAGTVTDGTVDFARPQIQTGLLSGWSEDSRIYSIAGSDAILLPSNTSWDTITTPGEYAIANATGANAPGSASYFVSVKKTGSVIKQIAYGQGLAASSFSRAYSGSAWSTWDFSPSRQNMVGTVSQSGGVPTGAIIERGSNANGTWVKFADGTMEVFGTIPDISLAANALGNSLVTFPIAFAAPPSYVAAIGVPNTSYDVYGWTCYNNLTASGVRFGCKNGGNAQSLVSNVYTAKGRWF